MSIFSKSKAKATAEYSKGYHVSAQMNMNELGEFLNSLPASSQVTSIMQCDSQVYVVYKN